MDPIEQPISLQPQEPAPQQVDMAPASVVDAPTLPPDIADRRASKASVAGIGDLTNQDYSQMLDQISSGQERQLREAAADSINAKQSIQQLEAVQRVAQQAGRSLSPEEGALVRTLVAKKQADPNSVIEDGFAQKFVDAYRQAALDNPDSYFNQAKDILPKSTELVLRSGEDYKAKQEYAQTLHEDMGTRTPSYMEWIKNISGITSAEQLSFIPEELKLRGLTPNTSVFDGALGQNLNKQVAELYKLPKDQFVAKSKAIAEKLASYDLGAAQQFTSALVGMSHQEEVTLNMNTLGTLTDVAGAAFKLGTKGAEALKLANWTRTAMRQGLKAELEPTKAALAEVAGNPREAGVLNATETVLKQMQGQDNPESEVIQGLKSAFNPVKSTDTPRFSNEFINRINERNAQIKGDLVGTVENTMKVDRIPAALAAEQNVRKLSEAEKGYYPGLENTINDVKFRHDNASNTLYADTTFTKNGVDLFGTEKEAQQFINKAKLGDAQITPQGVGFAVIKTRPFKENDYVVKMLEQTEALKDPANWLNALPWVGKARTAAETQSLGEMMQRHIATYTTSNFRKVVKDSNKEIADMKSFIPGLKKTQKYKEWKSVMQLAEKTPSKTTGEIKNLDAIETLQDIDQLYMNKWQRLPDKQEVAATYAHKRNLEMLDAFRRMNELKKLERIGTMNWKFSSFDSAKETAGTYQTNPYNFKGFQVQGEPSRSPATLLRIRSRVAESSGTEGTYDKLANMQNYWDTVAGKADMAAIKKGEMRLIQVSDPHNYPLANHPRVLAAGQSPKVEYVLAKNIDSKKMTWNDIKLERMPNAEYDHYVVQARMQYDPITKIHHYVGDRTIAAYNVGAEARDMAKHLDTLRELMSEGKEVEAKAYRDRVNLAQPWSQIKQWFTPEVSSEGITMGPKLNPTKEPITVASRGKMSIDSDEVGLRARYPNFEDSSRGFYGRFFKSERDPFDMFTTENIGTKQNPLYSLSDIKEIDPMVAINRSLNRAINSNVMDDFKIMAVENWIKNATPFLNTKQEHLNSAPYYFFHNPDWKAASGKDALTIGSLKTSNAQIKQFLGIQNETETFLHSVAQTIADSIYEFSPQLARLVPQHLLPKLHDPFAFVRSMVFHAKVGLFAIPQLLVQANTYATIFGVAGAKYAAPGTKAMLLHQWTRFNRNPAILDYLDKLASTKIIPGTSGWRPGEFKEFHALLTNSGFEHVGREYITRDDITKFNLLGGKWNGVLDAGQWFFKEGERSVRVGAFATAFREFRDAKPTGALSRADQAAILNRADMLSGNMSRASASAINQGVFSLASQFRTYTIRQAEMMLGKRLTGVERGRLFATYATLYGIPGAFGLTGVPIGDYLNKWSYERGYNYGEQYWRDALQRGIPELLLHLTTGNDYNVQERFGLNSVFDIKSDNKFADILMGAAGTTLGNTWSNMDGFLSMMISGIRGDGKFKPKVEDFVDPFTEVNSAEYAKRLYMALNTGKWFTKNEGTISDVSAANAIFMTLSGLSPQGTARASYEGWTRSQEKEWEREGINKFVKEQKRGYIEAANSNPGQAEDYFRRSWTHLYQMGVPYEKWGEAIAIATSGQNSIDTADYNFAKRDVNLKRGQFFSKYSTQQTGQDTANDQYSRLLNQKAQ